MLRLCWSLIGNVALLLTAATIANHWGTFLSLADAVFAGLVALVIFIRYYDIVHCNGLTATGEPATIRNWGNYAIGLSAASVVLWGAAHAWAYWHS